MNDGVSHHHKKPKPLAQAFLCWPFVRSASLLKPSSPLPVEFLFAQELRGEIFVGQRGRLRQINLSVIYQD